MALVPIRIKVADDGSITGYAPGLIPPGSYIVAVELPDEGIAQQRPSGGQSALDQRNEGSAPLLAATQM